MKRILYRKFPEVLKILEKDQFIEVEVIKKKAEAEIMDNLQKQLKGTFKAGQICQKTQTELRDIELKLRISMVDDFGREIGLDLPNLVSQGI